jgi:hypothetical protein
VRFKTRENTGVAVSRKPAKAAANRWQRYFAPMQANGAGRHRATGNRVVDRSHGSHCQGLTRCRALASERQ